MTPLFSNSSPASGASSSSPVHSVSELWFDRVVRRSYREAMEIVEGKHWSMFDAATMFAAQTTRSVLCELAALPLVPRLHLAWMATLTNEWCWC